MSFYEINSGILKIILATRKEKTMNELDNTFLEIVQIIEESRDNAYRKVNQELILMYQRIGKFLSEKSKKTNYGEKYIDSLAEYIHRYFPNIRGFTRRSLYRMKQFYET